VSYRRFRNSNAGGLTSYQHPHRKCGLPMKTANAQADTLLRAADTRRFAFTWALTHSTTNRGQSAAHSIKNIPRSDRTSRSSFLDLVRV